MEHRKYFGCLVRQRIDSQTVPFFVFHARIKDIRSWTGIRRMEEVAGGTQQVLREARARAITRFLQSDPINTIPNNLLIAFDPGRVQFVAIQEQLASCFPQADPTNGCAEQIAWGFLEFTFDPSLPDHLRPGLVVDGQHRLFGINDFQDEDIPILIVSLVDASVQEQAFQFIVVNSKQVKVPTDNFKAIIADLDLDAQGNALAQRLLKAGVRYGDLSPVLRDINDLPTSPFYHLLKWPYNRNGTQLIPVSATEQSLRYLRTLFAFLDEDEDSLVALFLSIWRAIKAEYPSLWESNDSKLLTKVNINALNEFIGERLKMAWEFGLVDIFNPEDVEIQVAGILDRVPAQFWENEWNIRLQDNASVREMIKEDLITISDNYKLRKHWNDDVKLVIAGES